MFFFLDEMITGLRVGGSSFQTSNKIKSDISTFGKCFGGGFPIGILAINKTTSQILKKKKIFFGGTFSGNSISMYIANEITKHVYKNNKLIKSLDEKMKFFKNSINEFALKNKIDAKVFSYTSMARIVFSQKKISDRTQRDFFESKKKKAIQKFIEFLKKKSLYYPKNGIIFFSLSLSKRDLLYIISTIKSALKLYLK